MRHINPSIYLHFIDLFKIINLEYKVKILKEEILHFHYPDVLAINIWANLFSKYFLKINFLILETEKLSVNG